MKIYITRHGQVVARGIGGDVQYPAGDPYLSELGRQQATCLGKQLKHLGFSGRLYTSPYARALETAECIAAETGSRIVPWAPMREVVKSRESILKVTGMTLEEIRQKYSHIDPEAELPWPWWTTEVETQEDVIARVRAGLEALDPQEDIMLIGHGASSHAACSALGIPGGGDGYNCHYTVYDSENRKECKRMDAGHLPYRMRSFNSIYQWVEDEKIVASFMEQLPAIPEAFTAPRKGKLLHIGDTHSAHYPYIRWIIAQTRPDIIIHTGDMVDQVKVGRAVGVREDYAQGVRELAQILKESGAEKIYMVPGNNDVPEIMKEELPFAEFVEPNTVVDICGISCALGHVSFLTNAPARWSFYGHGFTGETWSPEMNDLENGICRFNVIRGTAVILLPERKMHQFPNAPLYRWGKI